MRALVQKLWRRVIDIVLDGGVEVEISDNLPEIALRTEEEIWRERARIERRPTVWTAYVCSQCGTIQVTARECVICSSASLATLQEAPVDRIERRIPPRAERLVRLI